MREGYKMTELGELPEEWEVVKIDQLLSSGRIISHLDGNHGELYPKASEFVEDGIPYVGANSFINGRVDFSSCKRLTKERALNFKKGVAKDGDVLFAHNATVGPVAFLETDLDFVILSTTATYYRLDNKTIHSRYWLYFLASPFFSKQYGKVMGQSTRNQVPITMQRSFLSVLPPIYEQVKIAEILSTVDEKIEVIEEQINQTTELKKGLMQRLLTRGIGHTQFKQSPLGEIPQSWEVKKLNEISNVVRGGSPRPAGSPLLFNGKFLPWITVAELTNNPSTYLTKTKTALTELGSKQTRILEPNTVLLANSGATLGVPKILKIRAGANDGIAAFLNLTCVTKHYLYHYLSSLTKYFREQLAPGSGQPNLNTSLIGGVYITIPKIEEQIKIAEILSTVDEKLDVLQTKKQHYQDLKKGLMQQLLTGKIRVHHLIEREVPA